MDTGTVRKCCAKLIDTYWIVPVVVFAVASIYANGNAQTMAGLLGSYVYFKKSIVAGFSNTPLITFPLWGYGWLMLLTENKWCLLTLQVVLAVASLWYVVRFVTSQEFLEQRYLRLFKFLLMVSVPWYAFHTVRWPYSIAASLFLVSLILFYKAFTQRDTGYRHVMMSGFLFGVLLNFRSDYWLMPVGLCLLALFFFRSKKSIILSSIWLSMIYSCMIPWALYTKKACGHYLVTSTNAGHALFVGIGHDTSNTWGVKASDSDPLMHHLVAQHFNVAKHSTLDYEADIFLKDKFFEYVTTYPWQYAKKCMHVLYKVITGGFYPGEFFAQDQQLEAAVSGHGLLVTTKHALTHPSLVRANPRGYFFVFLTAFSAALGKLVLLGAYCVLPLVLWHALFRRNFFMLLVCAVIGYQTLLSCLCYYMPAYLSNLYVLYLLVLVFGMQLLFKYRRMQPAL